MVKWQKLCDVYFTTNTKKATKHCPNPFFGCSEEKGVKKHPHTNCSLGCFGIYTHGVTLLAVAERLYCEGLLSENKKRKLRREGSSGICKFPHGNPAPGSLLSFRPEDYKGIFMEYFFLLL